MLLMTCPNSWENWERNADKDQALKWWIWEVTQAEGTNEESE